MEDKVSRRWLLGSGAGLVVGVAAAVPAVSLLRPSAARASTPSTPSTPTTPSATLTAGNGVARLGEIYLLQAAFHRAKTTQDIDLMMSLWEPDAVLENQGDPNSPYTGAATLRTYWLGTGSFKNQRFSLVPSFKIRTRITGDTADLYFECHDVGDFAGASRAIVNDTFLAGTLKWSGSGWRFAHMTAGKATQLSYDHYYFP